jgi:hypothetical protein
MTARLKNEEAQSSDVSSSQQAKKPGYIYRIFPDYGTDSIWYDTT